MAQTAERSASKGRPLHIKDVQHRMPTGPDGSPPSEWYVRRVMKEIGQFKIGQWVYVYEDDFVAWLNTRLDD